MRRWGWSGIARRYNCAPHGCCNELLLRLPGLPDADRRARVEAQLRIRRGGEPRFVPGELVQPLLPLRRRLLREIEVLLEVPRLGVGELGVKAADLRRQPRREQPKALAGTGLDQRAREQEIELASGVRRAQRCTQAPGVA